MNNNENETKCQHKRTQSKAAQSRRWVYVRCIDCDHTWPENR